MDIREYDILTMKKAHPCGGLRWQVLRTGADFRLRCLGCGRIVEGPRRNFEKNVRKIDREPDRETKENSSTTPLDC
ncbi:MAG: DUF951 domain-containing protein [Oscillospiraceae bacterium]|nr:DUF951 domain-containing protein [Oscillospiraceae bacterium]